RQIQARVRRLPVLKFLLQTRDFPRAFYHCLCEVEASLHHLPRNDKALAILATAKEAALKADLAQLEQQALHGFIDDLELLLADLAKQLSASYFVVEASPLKRAG
ncbi:MAG: hypothetical protein QG662_2377, partial [Pseudomonadota bacterium]|nr:hypothetical protein [Pseudomonadota bacterium]